MNKSLPRDLVSCTNLQCPLFSKIVEQGKSPRVNNYNSSDQAVSILPDNSYHFFRFPINDIWIG